jgi:hypothetical protein
MNAQDNELNGAILGTFRAYLETRLDARAVSLFDRSESYVAEIANRWAAEFGRSAECAAVAVGVPLPQLARTLATLGQYANGWITSKRQSAQGWDERRIAP